MRNSRDLFGYLFSSYDDKAFVSSVELFKKRFEANGFAVTWFRGKTCLDAGCGGGRYSIALALLGAKEVFAIDISKGSLEDAERRAADLNIDNIKFRAASVEKLPFGDNSFDAVIFSGLLHHLARPHAGMREVSRVLKPRGLLYLLVYATGGIRWPLIQILRPIARKIGFNALDAALEEAALGVNKRRTYMDDLFVPVIDFYDWDRLHEMLRHSGFKRITRWTKGRFDHEEDMNAYCADLEGIKSLFASGARSRSAKLKVRRRLFSIAENICDAFLKYARRLSCEDNSYELVIGEGHHRVIAWKGY